MMIPARSTRPGSSTAGLSPGLLGLLVLALASACLAPRPGAEAEPEGGVEELGAMMQEAGIEPVVGTEEEGIGTPEPVENLEVDPEEARERLEAAQAESEAEPEPPVFEESPYIRFGERIIVREVEGVTIVTKPYTLPPGRPGKVLQLLNALDPFPIEVREANEQELPPFDVGTVELEILSGYDDEYYTNFAKFENEGANATAQPISDLMIVTAVPAMLERFEEFLDLFAGGGRVARRFAARGAPHRVREHGRRRALPLLVGRRDLP